MGVINLTSNECLIHGIGTLEEAKDNLVSGELATAPMRVLNKAYEFSRLPLNRLVWPGADDRRLVSEGSVDLINGELLPDMLRQNWHECLQDACDWGIHCDHKGLRVWRGHGRYIIKVGIKVAEANVLVVEQQLERIKYVSTCRGRAVRPEEVARDLERIGQTVT